MMNSLADDVLHVRHHKETKSMQVLKFIKVMTDNG